MTVGNVLSYNLVLELIPNTTSTIFSRAMLYAKRSIA